MIVYFVIALCFASFGLISVSSSVILLDLIYYLYLASEICVSEHIGGCWIHISYLGQGLDLVGLDLSKLIVLAVIIVVFGYVVFAEVIVVSESTNGIGI